MKCCVFEKLFRNESLRIKHTLVKGSSGKPTGEFSQTPVTCRMVHYCLAYSGRNESR